MTSIGVISSWNFDEGWGVISSTETPGGCWAHNAVLWAVKLAPARERERIKVSHKWHGNPRVEIGEIVEFEWERGRQSGFDYRAISVRPRRNGPEITIQSFYDDSTNVSGEMDINIRITEKPVPNDERK